MKLIISAALLALIVGAPTYALQEPDKDKEKPPKQEEPKKQEPDRQQPAEKEREKPQEKPQEKQPPRDAQKQDKEQSDRARQSEKQTQQNQQQTVKQQQQNEKDRAKQDRTSQEHAQQVQRDNGQQAQRDGGNHQGRQIRQEDFRAHFGREHAFRVARRDDRRFNYGGYWFVYNDPWPAGWTYDDDVYVDEIDGEYYLIDPVHPGIRLLIVVSD